MVMCCESSVQDFLYILPWKIHQAMAVICEVWEKKENMIKGHGRQDAWLRVFGGLLQGYTFGVGGRKRLDRRGQTGNRGGVHIGDRGATGVEFVANKLVVKEGSDCCGEWGVVCVTKGDGGMEPEGGTDAMMKGVWDPHTWLGFSCWGAALSPFPHPRILKTRPLLLHSVSEGEQEIKVIVVSASFAISS